MSGYPDYQAYPSWQAAPVIQEYGDLFPTGPLNFGPFPSGPYSGILIIHRNMAGSHRITVTWYTDPAGVNNTYSDVWDFQDAQTLVEFVPAGGPWYKVQISNTSATPQFGTLVVVPANGLPNGATHVGGPWNFPLVQTSQSVPAGTDLVVVPGVIYAGPATLSVHSGVATNWTVNLSVWDAANAVWDAFMTLSGNDYGFGAVLRISLPRKAVQLDMHNGSTAARTLTVSLAAG